jgi:hypothetical protein
MTLNVWKYSTPVEKREKPVKQAVAVSTSPDLATLRSALDAIPNDTQPLDYDAWRNVIFGIHEASGGSADGLSLAHAFSARSSKYDADFLDNRVWPYIGQTSGDVITAKSIYRLAGLAGWQDPAVLDDFGTVEADDFSDVDTDASAAPRLAKAKKFEFVKAARFAAGAPPGWIVRGVLPRAALGVFYGESGAGKSFGVLDLLGHIVEDRDWRGCKTTPGLSAGYIVAEGAAGFRLRLDAFSKHHDAHLERLAVMAGQPRFMERDDIIAVGKSMLAYGRMDLLVVDTLAQVTAGANENSGEDMGRVIAHCQTLHAVTGAMVLLVHHSGKDASKGARGWSGIKGALDVEIEVTRNGEDRALTVTKLKDGQGEGTSYGFRLTEVPLGMDDDGEVFGSCIVTPTKGRLGQAQAAPKGKHESLVHEVVMGLLDAPEAPDVNLILTECAARMPQDPQRRDARRQHARRALESLIQRGAFVLKGTRIELVGGSLAMSVDDLAG